MVKLRAKTALRPADAARNVKIYGTKSAGSITQDKFLKFFDRIDSKIGRGTVYDVLVNMRQVLLMGFETGMNVHVPELGVFRLVGRGVEDPDNPAKNSQTLSVNLLIDSGLKAEITPTTMEATTEVQETVKPQPLDFLDVASGTHRGTVTPGGLAVLSGKNLRLNPTKSDEGIWFVPAVGSENPTLKVSKIKTPIGSTEVVFMAPSELMPGELYTLRIVARQRNCKTAQSAELANVLTVA